MIHKVRYCYQPRDRNAGIAVVFGAWPERVMRHRGWTPEKLVCTRVATEQEHIWLSNCMRHQAFLYNDTEEVCADEAQIVAQNVLERIMTSLQRAVRSAH